MGNLSNLYISQSYTSLAHLGTDNALVPGTMTMLQDGIGQSLNISFNGTDISSSGNIYGANLQGLSSTASFNAYTASTNNRLNNLESTSASVNISVTNLNAYTSSNDSKVNQLISATASYANSASVAAVDAAQQSQINQLITATGSYITTPLTSLNAFTQSQDTKNTTLATYTASVDQKFSNIGSQSGSWVTESETGSFARYDVSNPWSVSQTFTQITSSTARIAGLNYPTADNGAESFIQTNGAGTLSLQYVKTMYQNIRNRESVTINKGTPLFASGSTGDNVDVYIADASNPLRMPATLIAGDTTLAAGATGKGIIFGHIEGVDTNAYPAGTEVYVGVGGGWTATRPTGSTTPIQPLGVVTRQGNNGMGIVMTETPYDLPNIQTGYTWVGNGNNQPVAVATSSFASVVDLTSLNSFTASQLVINSGYNTFTASAQSQLTALENATSSYAVSSSVATAITNLSASLTVTDQYLQSQIDALDPSGSAASVALLNAFTASQETKNSTLATYTASVDLQLTNLSTSQSIDNQKWVNIAGQSGSWGGGSTDLTSLNAFTASQEIKNTTLENVTSSLQSFTASQETKDATLASVTASLQQQLTNIGTQSGSWVTENETGSFLVTASVNLNTITFTKGDTSTFNITVDTGSAVTTDLTSLNAFTASQETKNSTLATYTASIDTKFSNLASQSGSWITESETGSFATTGSNNFAGNQIISGTFIQSGSNSLPGGPGGALVGTHIQNRVLISGPSGGETPRLYISGSDGAFTEFGRGFINQDTTKVSTLGASIYTAAHTSSQASNTVAVYNQDFSTDVELTMFAGTSSVGLGDWDNGSTFTMVPFLTVAPNLGNNPSPTMTRGLIITGSTNMQQLTASLQQGYVWVGDASGKTTTVATSSFGGGAAFPYTGTASISGSLQVTGSMSGLPNELTVTSNTASIDFTKGNFFSITLPASAKTHFTVANTIKGQTINIQINQPAGASTGSVAFSPSILFAGGNDYQATATGSAIDLLTMVSITGSSVLATSIKNFL